MLFGCCIKRFVPINLPEYSTDSILLPSIGSEEGLSPIRNYLVLGIDSFSGFFATLFLLLVVLLDLLFLGLLRQYAFTFVPLLVV